MRIDNIIVSNENLNNLTATISFDIKDLPSGGRVNVFIRMNGNDYQLILENQRATTVTRNLKGLKPGVNYINIKIANDEDEYISESIMIKLKTIPSIEGLECVYSDSTGKFILNFTIVGDESFTYNVALRLDNEENYSEIMQGHLRGEKSYESKSSMGYHECQLKVYDDYDEFETDILSFEIANQIPIISKVLVEDIGNYRVKIYYAVKDVEGSKLTHKLIIDGMPTTIKPNKTNDFYSYETPTLSTGTYEGFIAISDGMDLVQSDAFIITIFETPMDEREILKQAKDKYDMAYQSLRDIILSVVADGIFNYDVENEIIQKAQENYTKAYSEFNRTVQRSIDIIGTNKVSTTKQDLETQIFEVYNAVDSLESTMGSVFKDGVLSDAEKKVLRNDLNLIAKEKVDIDRDYDALYNNKDLISSSKENLKNSYDLFIIAHNNLVLDVNDLINSSGIVNDVDINNISASFESWRTALGNYRDSSLKAIDAIAKKKADDSSDTVDKKWAEIVLDPDTGIQTQVGDLQTTVSGHSNRIANVEITASSINSTVSTMQTNVTNLGTRVTNAETKVTQLSNKITSSVTENDVKSIIEQSPTEIRYGFNDISDYVTISSSGLTVNRGSVACDILCTPSGHDPIIKLFGTDGNCAIDATKRYNSGWGTAIRLKWDDYNYYYISDNVATIYQYGYESFMFQTDSTYRDKSKIMTPNGILVFDGSNSYDIYDNANKRLTYEGVPIVLQKSKFIETASVGGGGSWYDKDRPGSGLYFASGTTIGMYAGKTASSTATGMFTFFWDSDSNPAIRASHTSKNLTFGVSGLYYAGGLVLTDSNYTAYCAKSSHTHSGYASSSHTHNYASSSHSHSGYMPTDSSTTLWSGSHCPYYTNSYNLGWSQERWQQVCAKDVYADYCSASDVSFKENIKYLKSDNVSLFSSDEEGDLLKPNEETNINLGITSNDLYEFVKNELQLCEYNYTDDYSRNSETGEVIRTNFENKLGFIAQDIQNTKVGNLIVGEWEGQLSYNLNNYVSVLGGALQYEIATRDAQIESLESTISDLEERIKELENKLK